MFVKNNYMNRIVWIIGLLLLVLHGNDLISQNTQTVIFIIGVVVVGVPHGAADLLVGAQNAAMENRVQSGWKFLSGYIFKLFLFGSLLYIFPVVAISVFFVMAAFHFGETDLYHFNTETITGKVFAFSYGLLIIGFILLFHVDEAIPILSSLTDSDLILNTLNELKLHKEFIASLLLIFFFSSTFLHFMRQPGDAMKQELFLWRLIALLVLLYLLPLLAGFFFYFVVWHSIESLRNISEYLQKYGEENMGRVIKTIISYSLFTFGGITVLFYLFRTVLNQQSLVLAAFAALAILTAPHMEVMHRMYNNTRKQ